MAITAISYAPPIRRSIHRPALDFELFEQAVALADEGRRLESTKKVFEHFFPGKTIPDLTKEAFTFVQGSSRVTVRIEGDDFTASVPLVKLPQGGSSIAAMRHVLTAISCTGQLYQPRLRGDDVHLEFRDPVARLHPAKIVEVLQRMPAEADQNDDWLIGQFNALPLERADIASLTNDEVARAGEIWKAHWNEVEELLKECQRKRSYFFLNELTAFAVYRIMCVLPIHGFLAARIREAMGTFNDTDEDPMKREASLAKCVKDMRAVTNEELAKNMGHVEYALSPTSEGTPSVLHAHIGDCDYMETIEGLLKGGKSMDAALALVGTYYFMLVRFSWPEEMAKDLVAGLASVAGKPWRETAAGLVEHAASLAEKYEDDEEDEDEEDEDESDEEDEDGDDEDEES
jgi:hypothetical protein